MGMEGVKKAISGQQNKLCSNIVLGLWVGS